MFDRFTLKWKDIHIIVFLIERIIDSMFNIMRKLQIFHEYIAIYSLSSSALFKVQDRQDNQKASVYSEVYTPTLTEHKSAVD